MAAGRDGERADRRHYISIEKVSFIAGGLSENATQSHNDDE